VSLTVVDGAREEAKKAGVTLEEFLAIWCRRGSQGLEAAWLKPEERRAAAQSAESFRERDQRAAADRVREMTGGLAHDKKRASPLPFEAGYSDVVEGEAHEQRRIAAR
jgi:hypothetical protein